jgi:pimeloyl-ACP methyl ester carboxylesterase
MDKPTIPPPLADFAGRKPPARAWFDAAIAHLPERSFHAVRGARIETLTWGERGKPGLLLLHGGAAHADWWSFIAPFFAATHRVAAMSWSGMGRSDWRKAYDLGLYVEEMLATATVAGLFEGPAKPVVLAHSFGSFPTMACAARHGSRLGGIMILDAPIQSPQAQAKRDAERGARKPPRDTIIYDSLEAALLRFRLQPVQTCENPYIADYIARASLREVDRHGGGKGWTWRFDPYMWSIYQRGEPTRDLAAAGCPVAILWGARSSLFPPDTIAFARATAPPGTLFVEIPDADHHVMIDQPLALVAAARAILAAWQ